MGQPQSLFTFLYKALSLGLCLAFCAASVTAAQPAQRIHKELSDYSRFSLSGNVHPAILNAQDQGAASSSTPMPRMTIQFSPTPSQNADLMQLLRLQQTRGSTQFHQWLTPEQYADRFGLNANDIQKVTAWLETMGFSNVEAARSRTFVTFDGTSAQAQAAFHTAIHRYNRNGESHIANATAPELPSALNGMVAGIRGLHDFHPRPHSHPHFTSSISGNHYLAPDDFATIYDIKALYGNGIDGTGRVIAIPGQTDLIMSDIEAFQTASGLPVKDPQVFLSGADPGVQTSSGDLGESDLDIEWAGAIAKGATILFYNSGDVFTSVVNAIQDNKADVLAITYGECEAGAASDMATMDPVFMQAAAQGMTVTAASGDNGAADCDTPPNSSTVVRAATQGLAVDYPSSSPYVTSMGGTEFNEGTGTYWNSTNNSNSGSAISYIPEIAWNDTSTTNGLEGSGGGASTVYAKPAWQTGTGVPADNKRDVPDLAIDSSPNVDGYLTCSDGSCVNGYRMADTTLTVTGGTSAASPTFAAIVALLDQQTGTRQGLVNQTLYTLASFSSNGFHDITSGNNIIPCRIGTTNCTTGTMGFSAGTGYDQVTGLGSIDAYILFQEWSSDFSLKPSVTSLTLNPGSSGTATISVSPYKSFTGNVTFTCSVSSALANVTCSIPGTVSGGTGTATLTVTASASAGAPWWRQTPRGLFYLMAGMLLASSAYLLTRDKKLRLPAFAFTLLLVVGLSSCGGGSSTTTTTSSTVTPTAESGTVTITGTSGSLVNTTSIAVTIN